MHTPCPTPVINNQDKSRTGVTRCTIPVCILLLLVTLPTPCTLYWASLIHRLDGLDQCWCAIVTIHSLPPSPLSRVLLRPPFFAFFFFFFFRRCCPSAIAPPFPVNRSQPYVSYIYVLLISSYLYLESRFRRRDREFVVVEL